jgi:hypothetical protein
VVYHLWLFLEGKKKIAGVFDVDKRSARVGFVDGIELRVLVVIGGKGSRCALCIVLWRGM